MPGGARMDKPVNPFDFFRMREEYEVKRLMQQRDPLRQALATYEEFLKQEQEELIQKAIRQDVALARDRIAVKKQVQNTLSKRAATSGAAGGNNRSLKFKPLRDWATEQPTRKGENPHAKATRLYRSVPSELIKGVNDPVGVMDRAIRKALKQK